MTTREDLRGILSALDGRVPDADEYQRLCTLTIEHPAAAELARLDPFSDDYRAAAMRLYLDLRGRPEEGYEPTRDEASGAGVAPAAVFSNVPPWSFRDTGLVSEFLMSWGHILRLLDLPAGSGASVLEYGPGSGQILLMLARLGCRAFGVDIDAGALAAIRAQAEAMGVEVATERARFGEGFEGRRFDRVVFFEAFHHAFDFQAVMRGLHARLEPGGRVVFCGEPIVPAPGGSVPYPWGPRLDGLSVFCMQRFGWMELGFTRPFFLAAMRRAGWRVRHHPFPGCGRADAFVAEPLSAAEARGDYELRPAAIGADPGEWGVPEAAHVWTVGPGARIPLLHGPDALVDVTLRAANFLPVKKRVRVSCGDRAWEGVLRPGTAEAAIVLRRCSGTEVRIECQLHSPMELVPGSADARRLGVAVLGLRSVAVPGAS